MRPEIGTDASSAASASGVSIGRDAHPLVASGSIPARFAELAERFADKTAIQSASSRLTYGELNARANRLAHVLLQRWPAPARIALLFSQGARPIVSLLGVLKAGHAFVPLDAADPPARLRTILEDCEPGAIVTDDQHADLAAELGGDRMPVLNLERDVNDFPEYNPDLIVPPDALAYIFYTSGSTGQPKGVCQIHRNVLHYMGCYCDTLGVSDRDRFSLLYTLSFSASNMDVFGALLYGATLCPYNIRQRGTAELADWLDREAITILHAVPTVFRHLLQNLKPNRRFDSIRGIDLGGEAVYPGDVALYRAHFREHCLLVNHLAATEFCVIAQYPVDRQAVYRCDMLPVGRSPAASFIRIRREDGHDAGVSEPGEMVVHSPFLSPGYWRRPDLNEKAFADDPDRPGWRTYTSGDLGYINSDGDLCFLGRKDHRVKIRGNTVDTAEVEAALRECAWIRNVAVAAREDEAGEASRQLVAFIEAGEAPAPAKRAAALREFLKDRLPSYMIPARFAFLESLPRTASGKLDRKALAVIELPTEPESSGEADAAPESGDELEATICLAFQEILRLKTVRPSDDFFLLGGDSLKATQLHLELEGYLGRRIPLEKLFAQPTVAGIAAFLRQWRNESSDTDSQDHRLVVPLRETGARPKLFLTHGAKGQAFVSPHFLRLIGEDQPVYAFQALGLDRSRMPNNSIEEMAAEYVRALREIQPRGPYFLGSICVGGVLTLEMARQLVEAGETVGPLLLIDPPVVPPGHRHWWKRYRRARRARLKKKHFQPTSGHKLVRNLRAKKRKGTNFIDVDDAEVMMKAAHAAFDFELAVLKHRVKPYAGDVMILRSKERQAKQYQRRYKRIKLKYPFEGDVRMWEIEGKHDQLLDVNNEDFAAQLPKCMAEIWRAFERT